MKQIERPWLEFPREGAPPPCPPATHEIVADWFVSNSSMFLAAAVFIAIGFAYWLGRRARKA